MELIMSTKVNMSWARETKGTHVYAAADEKSSEIIPTLYIKKSTFKGESQPLNITVTITEVVNND
ncbi:hypothetical protein NVP1083O_52 [Vibrio phage 1.083.O._10N.286.52.B9]|nr:hypothetical protein NVP1083O_52 [Vibrio phage 1.083.O._10N.286.52.B9]